MAFGGQWGNRQEMLHPRDSHGRFRSTWSMPTSVVDKIMGILDGGNPKLFASEDEARNYVGGLSAPGGGSKHTPSVTEFLKNFGLINDQIRAGQSPPSAKSMDAAMRPLPDDLFLTQNVGPETFGLDATTLPQVEELTGKLVHDKGFTSMNVGAPVAHGPGQVQLSIATPKGTKAMSPGTGRELILSRDQPLRVTKVDPDGQGGHYVYAVATDASQGETSVDIRNAVPKPGEESGGVDAPAVGGGAPVAPVAPGAGQGGPGRPPGPGPAPRNDGHVGIVGAGPDAGTPAPVGAPGEAPAPSVDLPQIPEPGEDSRTTFRDAFEKSDLKVPSVGTRRKQYMDAYNGVASGKKTPQEAVRDLDNAITLNKKMLASDKLDGTDSGPLPEDIKRQEALSDLIKEHFNFTGRKDFKAPEEKKTPEKTAVPEKKPNIGGDLGKLNREQGEKKVAEKKAPVKKAAVPEKKAPEVKAPEKAADKAEVTYTYRYLKPGEPGFSNGNHTIHRFGSDGSETHIKGFKSEHKTRADKMLKGLQDEEKQRQLDLKKKTSAPEKKVSTPEKKAAAPEKKAPEAPGDVDKMTIPQLREEAKKRGIKIPSATRRKADIQALLKGEKAPEAPEKKSVEAPGDIDKMTIPQLREEAKRRGIKIPSSARRKADILEAVKGNETAKKDSEAIREGVKAPEIEKPVWGTMKTNGLKYGDEVMYHGQDRRAAGKGQKVRIGKAQYGGYQLVDTETGKTVGSGSNATRSWFSKVPEKKGSEVKAPEIKEPEKKAPEIKAPEEKKSTAAERQAQRLEERRKAAEQRKADREEVAAEKKRAAEKDAEDRRVAKEARMRLAGERQKEREAEVERKARERKAATEKAAEDRKAAREKAAADRKAERERLVAEKKKQEEAQKKQVALTEHEVRVNKKMEDLRKYIGKTDGMTMDQLRVWADKNKVTVPPELRTKEQVREYVLRQIAEKEVGHDEDRLRVPELLKQLRREKIPFLGRYKYKDSQTIEKYADKVRAVTAGQGIDPKKFKPEGSLTRPKTVTGGNGTWSEADWDTVLPRNTDPNHPVRINGWRTPDGYEFEHGVAVRKNGVTYILETTAENQDNPHHIAMLTEGFERFHNAIPERGQYQHHYNWFLGANPGDEYWKVKYNNKNHVSLASAGNGRVNMWRQGGRFQYGGNATPFDFHDTLNHEFGHNVDRDHLRSGSLDWSQIGYEDLDTVNRKWKANKLVAVPMADMRPLTPERAVDRGYPNGISNYGKSSPSEDFAESLAYYFMDIRIAYNQETGEPFFFEDLYPARTAYLDKLFPRRARERKALRAAERARLAALRTKEKELLKRLGNPS